MAKPTATAKARPAVTAAPSLQPVQSATIPTPSVPVPTATPQQRVRCTVSVDCKTAVEAGYEPAIQLSTSGVMLSTAVEVAPGSSVYDALTAAAKQTGIPISTSGSGKRVYIVSICSLAERDFGTKSGWMYSVNGQYPSVSCGARTVLDGDRIAFRYTLNLGKDLGASVQ